jgi:integral membrane protein (TIGR01906 family)
MSTSGTLATDRTGAAPARPTSRSVQQEAHALTIHKAARPWRGVAGIGTAIVIVGVAAAILLLPPVMNLGLEIAGSAAMLGVPAEVARRASELSVQELLFGPGSFTFAATPGGPPFFGPAEVTHMQNVRVVVYGFFGLVLAGAIAVALSTRRMGRPGALRAVRLGATALVLVFAAIGIGLVIAFDALFTLFHRIVFPGGGWLFDPTTQRIVQLYPTPFWEFAAGALAGLSVAIGLLIVATTTLLVRRSKIH